MSTGCQPTTLDQVSESLVIDLAPLRFLYRIAAAGPGLPQVGRVDHTGAGSGHPTASGSQMERVRAAGLGLIIAVAACSPAPTPSPAPALSPTPDPRLTVLEDRAATWKGHQPPAYAYTFTHSEPGDPSRTYRYRVSAMEGRVDAQHVSGVVQDAAGVQRMAIEGLVDTAETALADPGELTWTFDQLLGYPTELAYAGPDGAWTETVTEFTTPADRGSASRAREAMTEALARWAGASGGSSETTWSRYPAAGGPEAGTTWRIRREGGKITAVPEGGADATVPPEEATLDRTIAAAGAVVAAGGWVDLALDTGPDPGLLVAVDPSPSVKGDAYWIRLASQGIVDEPAADTAAADLVAAEARWAAAAPAGYTYTWRYRGEGGPLTYRVTRKGGKTTIKRGPGTPAPTARSHAAPRVEATFAMLEAVLAQGGRVKATYDPKLGYPRRVEVIPAGDAGARGVITFKGFKAR